jgi:hypothetical protein
VEVKKKLFLRERVMNALRPLSSHVVLALGFPTCSATPNSSDVSQVVGHTQQKLFGEHQVGNPLTERLFGMLHKCLEGSVEAKPRRTR